MASQSLEDLFQDEIADLISANQQMQRVVDNMASKAQDLKVKQLLTNSVNHINEHTEMLQSLHQGDRQMECRAMVGLVEEAQRHSIDADLPAQLRDVAMLAHYQRMSHYGVAGFGTAAAYARVLGRKEDADKLTEIVGDIYAADEFSSQLAVSAERAMTKS